MLPGLEDHWNMDSPWNRDIHKFMLHGLRILLDVNSGSVHILDEASWDVLEALEQHQGSIPMAVASLENKYSPAQLAEVVSELEGLREQELLFTSDREVMAGAGNPAAPAIKSMCFNMAHDCNMRCGYCFAADISFGGTPQLMSREVGEAAMDFLLEQSGSRRHLEVDFFGGEPLLNLDTVAHLTEYGTRQAEKGGKAIKFTITTNCLLMDKAFTELVNRYNMQVVLSLDGRKTVHDAVRRAPGGAGTYDVIVPRMLQFTESRHHENYYVRGTYTRKNMDFADDVFHLFDLGFRHVSLEPVVAPPEAYGFSEEDIPLLEKEYERLAAGLLERHEKGQFIDFFHFNVDLEGGVCIPKRIKGCGAGVEYLAAAPDGRIYPCHQFVGSSRFLMGEVFQGLKETAGGNGFREAHIYNKKICRNCWARFFCSGGCHANAYHYSGSLMEPYAIACALQKKRLECGIWYQLCKRLGRNTARDVDN